MKYIIYHQVKKGVDCPDGLMAASIAALACPKAELLGDWYNSDRNLLNTVTPRTEIIVVDFSYPAERLKAWESRGARITLIDHHAPMFPMLEGFSGAILDADECGATLTWKHFFPDKPQPPILAHVRRRDIGADGYYKAPENCLDSKAITAALSYNRSKSDDPISYLQATLQLADLSELQKQGEAIAAKAESEAQAIALRAWKTYLPYPAGNGKVQCWTVELANEDEDKLTSLIGAAVCQREGEGSICWIQGSGETDSLRSNGVDISGYAKQLGGGGHAFAAGFKKK